MKNTLSALVLLTLALSSQVYADGHEHGSMKDMDMPAGNMPADHAQAGMAMTSAVVRKVDKAQGKITLKHDEIKNLSMPGMVMVFKAKEPKMLENINAGDTVEFAADRIEGELTVTSLKKKTP